MIPPYEEPEKSGMRPRVEIAIDKAGFALAGELADVPIAPELGLQGSLKGDIQSMELSGLRTCYFLRPRGAGALPTWLANLARISHDLAGVRVYVVVLEADDEFIKTCKIAGAGVLRLAPEDAFETLVSFDDLNPSAQRASFTEGASAVRAELVRKVDLLQSSAKDRLATVKKRVAEMDDAVADKYIGRVESDYRAIDAWSDQISRELDAVTSALDEDALSALSDRISVGPDFLAGADS